MKHNILLIIILLAITVVAGCTSPNNGQNNSHDTPIKMNNATNSQITDNTSLNGIKSTKYEASGLCYHVVDGDTIDVEGVGRIRLVGVNTPEKGQSGYQSATDFVKSMCLGKTVGLDIDDAKHYDKYDRTLAVVYVDGFNLNQELLKRGYAEVMYIPPSEFNPYSWT